MSSVISPFRFVCDIYKYHTLSFPIFSHVLFTWRCNHQGLVWYWHCVVDLMFLISGFWMVSVICPWNRADTCWPTVTEMQHYYHARYPTDDWHIAYMFSLVYFSVEVCLEGVLPHPVSTRQDSCVSVYAPLTLAPPSRKNKQTNKQKNRTGVTQLCTWTKRGGIWTDAWVCLHYWVVIWVAG